MTDAEYNRHVEAVLIFETEKSASIRPAEQGAAQNKSGDADAFR